MASTFPQGDSERSPLLPAPQQQPETTASSAIPAASASASSSSPEFLSLPPPLSLASQKPATTVDDATAPRPPPASPSALARPSSEPRPRPQRSVTFHPNPVTHTIDASPSHSPSPPAALGVAVRSPGSYGTTATTSTATGSQSTSVSGDGAGGTGGTPPVFVALNNRLRRRNSYGSMPATAASQPPFRADYQQNAQQPKIGPQRSTKKAQKLKLLPNPDFGDEGPDEESGRDVYSQYTRIKDPTARRDAALLGKADRARLPRVTAYCTANRYEMDGLMRFLKGRSKTRGGNPKLIDECIYTPYNYDYGKAGSRHAEDSRHSLSYLSSGNGDQNERTQQQQQLSQRQEEEEWNQPQASVDSQATHIPERRHSTGEVDSDSPLRAEQQQQQEDNLLDLESGAGYTDAERRGWQQQNEHLQHGQLDEEAIIEGDGSRRTRTRSDLYANNSGDERRGEAGAMGGFQGNEDSWEHEYGQEVDQGERREAAEREREREREREHEREEQARREFEQQLRGERPVDFDIHVHTPELFLFDYGVVVIWGMSEAQEQRFLKELAKFETEKLAADDVEAEFFNFYYTREYQARIYNDFIALRDNKRDYMTKLAISHALAQSVKTSLFEELIASTIDTCKDIPTQIALTGTIALSRTQINMQIGELFILRINIHLNGSVLDTPELFWVEPQLEPVYQAVRSYLEMDQRVGLLTQRLDVIADLLAVLKEQLSHGHDEKLEWIVIVLIAAEILVAAINIIVDIYAG